MHPVDDLASFLVGSWQLTREIIDRRTDTTTWMSGTANVHVDTNVLVQQENGLLDLGDQQIDSSSSRRYLLRDPAVADVTFEDGRPFHDLDLRTGSWSPTYLCGADKYEGKFIVIDQTQWTTTWTVTGPAKDMTLVSSYERGTT